MSFVISTVDGGFSDWIEESCLSDAGKECGFRGTKYSFRTCTNPRPAHGGKECEGDIQKAENCPIEPCPRELLV